MEVAYGGTIESVRGLLRVEEKLTWGIHSRWDGRAETILLFTSGKESRVSSFVLRSAKGE